MVKTAGSIPSPSHGGESLEEPIQWPSAIHKEQVAKNRPPVVASATLNDSNFTDPEAQEHWKKLNDPATALEGVHGKPVVVKERISVKGEFDGESSQKVNWLGCDSREEAEGYVERVGDEYQDPGPGEDLGVFEYREIYDNPNYDPAAAKEAKIAKDIAEVARDTVGDLVMVNNVGDYQEYKDSDGNAHISIEGGPIVPQDPVATKELPK